MCKELIKLLKKPFKKEEQSVPVPSDTVTGKELAKLVSERFPNIPFFMSDTTYRLCSAEDIDVILAMDDVDRLEYKDQMMDCDDFAYALQGHMSVPPYSDLCFGLVWTNTHALNIFLDRDKKFWFVEPQTDQRSFVLDSWQGSVVRFILI